MRRRRSQLTPGERIASWRRIRGVSTRKLAQSVGISYSALNRVERGKQHARATDMEKIAKAFGLTMAEFYGASDDEPKEAEG